MSTRPMKLTPEQLEVAIRGCMDGDRRCQEQVFKEFFGKMMSVCMRYTRDKDTAQDMLQDAFIKTFDKIGDFNFSGSFEGWLRRIVVNTAIDHIRRNKQMLTIDDDSLIKDEDKDSVGAFQEENEDLAPYANVSPEMIMEAMQKLSPAYQAVFNLYVFENYTHKDIADALQISVGTSKSNFAKAKMRLKILLQKQLSIKE
ncbi:MAG TPA: sigma-70 family RNA polymerase sigma factor [Flavobacteriales bacterium]|nr:sigma-70 family RNA polymerase sigma factor [Flavobacteriales bacterium]HRE96763.1 sigma-70 family RNA polymerase sigma factor [Flavobacteriales bacterium]HRJ36915.1 sigma-70 family RNA polymerase sigma factor [Flavobacteriales bacterium]HRJ37741.1 sigma-70 family RNA polymerase sigma factor [Flavobacteriales bacterium]